jgi:hypothetical protein
MSKDACVAETSTETQPAVKKERASVSPLTTALIAGAVGLMGTFVAGILNLQVEKRKQQGTLIVESIKTGDAQAAARNLLFLSEAGLINLSKEQVDRLKRESGPSSAPVLPPAGASDQLTFTPSGSLTDQRRKELESLVDRYQRYLQVVGYQARGSQLKVDIRDGALQTDGAIAYYDPRSTSIVIDSRYVSDPDLPLHEYSHHVLLGDRTVSSSWYSAIEYGLSAYFPCSFKNEPTLARITASIDKSDLASDLTNRKTFTRVTDAPDWPFRTGEIWGAAFWEVRGLLGQETADQLLYMTWSSTADEEATANDPKRFVKRLVDAVRQNDSARADTVRQIFSRRGVSV